MMTTLIYKNIHNSNKPGGNIWITRKNPVNPVKPIMENPVDNNQDTTLTGC
jgi:hypothetical protein